MLPFLGTLNAMGNVVGASSIAAILRAQPVHRVEGRPTLRAYLKIKSCFAHHLLGPRDVHGMVKVCVWVCVCELGLFRVYVWYVCVSLCRYGICMFVWYAVYLMCACIICARGCDLCKYVCVCVVKHCSLFKNPSDRVSWGSNPGSHT